MVKEGEARIDRLKIEHFNLNKKLEELNKSNSRLKELVNQVELENKALRREIREMIEQCYVIREEAFEGVV